MKTWVVKHTSPDDVEQVLNDLTREGYEIFAINSSPKPGFAYHEYLISAFKDN